MKIPKTLFVGGQKWTVELKKLHEIDSQCNGGWCKWEQNTILIAEDVPIDRQEEIFLHELLHAINVYLSEKEVEYLAGNLHQVLKENNINFNAPSWARFDL